MSDNFITLSDIDKVYSSSHGDVSVLSGLNLTIDKKEFVALMGPSGSGKSTLLNLIGGLDRPTSGQVSVGQRRIDALPQSELTSWRSENVGFIFQFYNLLPILNARKNIELPLLLLPNLTKSQRRERADIALEIVGLSERAHHKPSELSGGQQQRVAIARAIVSDPELLVCDEPTGDLDRKMASEILELLQLLNTKFGKTIVMVTHDPKAATYANRCVYMDKGTLSEIEAVEEPVPEIQYSA